VLVPYLELFWRDTHDLVLQMLGQHLPPFDAHSMSSLHLGVQVETCEYEGHSGESAKVQATRAEMRTSVIVTFMVDGCVWFFNFCLKNDKKLFFIYF
jgi:hypothetical protein